MYMLQSENVIGRLKLLNTKQELQKNDIVNRKILYPDMERKKDCLKKNLEERRDKKWQKFRKMPAQNAKTCHISPTSDNRAC